MNDITKHLRTIASRGRTTDEDNQWLFDVADHLDRETKQVAQLTKELDKVERQNDGLRQSIAHILERAGVKRTGVLTAFVSAKIGDEAYTYRDDKGLTEFGWVTDLEYFEERDDEIVLTRQRWVLVAEDKVTLPDPYEEDDR
jgi:hypothetical protein